MTPVRHRSGREPQAIRSGATGLMTSFVGWRQAFEFAVMARQRQHGSHRECPHCEPQPPIPGTCAWPAPRSARWRSAARRMAADMPLKAPYLRPAFDWSGFYIGGHTGYGRGSSIAVLADPAVATTSSVVSGVIGGVQAGYNYRLSLRPAARRRSRSDLSELSAVESRLSPSSRRRAPIVEERLGLCRHRARPHRLRQRPVARLRHRRIRLGRRTLPQHADRRRRRGKAYQRPAGLGRRRRPGICLRAALEREA